MDPVIYHAHHSRHSDDLPFWQQMAAARGGPVLELGCGTGRVLVPLIAQGVSVVGLDRDPAMLGFLRARQTETDRLFIVQSDLRQFAFGVRFSLVILPCNTLTTLSTADRQALYQCVRSHLAPEGSFVASFPNPAVLVDLPLVGEPVVEEIFPHPEGGDEVQVCSAWERSEAQVTIYWRYDWMRADGLVQQTTMDQVHHIIPVETLRDELDGAGLFLEDTYGDFNWRPYEIDAPYCIISAGLGH